MSAALVAFVALADAGETMAARRPISRIAFGSCANQARPQPIWDAVVETRPSLFLFIGDAVYADTTEVAVMRKGYDALAAQPGFQRLRRTTPILSVWDDHDYGLSDGGSGHVAKKASRAEHLRCFGVPPGSPRWGREGLYHAQVFGPSDARVQVILLDGRWSRSDRDASGRLPADGTMLGETQWRWLERRLRERARLRLVVSGVSVISDAEGGESWGELPAERERLLRTLESSRGGGVILLSGDRHYAQLSCLPRGGWEVLELTSSGLNNAMGRPADRPNPHRVGPPWWSNNFGEVRVDWTQPDPRVELMIHEVEGGVVVRHAVRLSELVPRGHVGSAAER